MILKENFPTWRIFKRESFVHRLSTFVHLLVFFVHVKFQKYKISKIFENHKLNFLKLFSWSSLVHPLEFWKSQNFK